MTTFFQWKWIRHKGVWEAEEKCQKSSQRVTLQLVLNASFVWVLDWAGMNYDKYKMILVCSCRVFSTQLFKRKKKQLRSKKIKEQKNPPKNKQKTPAQMLPKLQKLILKPFSITAKSNCMYQTNVDINILQLRRKSFLKAASPNTISHCSKFLSVVKANGWNKWLT